MHTPHKRIFPFHRPDILLIEVPLQGPIPHWAEDLHRWIREQGQLPPYGMSWEFYDLHNRGSIDRDLTVMIHCIACLDEQARASTNQILDVGATAKVTSAWFRHLDEDHDQTCMIIDCL